MKIISLYNRLSISLESGIISGFFEEQFVNKLNGLITGNTVLRKRLFKNNKTDNSFTHYYKFKKIFF